MNKNFITAVAFNAVIALSMSNAHGMMMEFNDLEMECKKEWCNFMAEKARMMADLHIEQEMDCTMLKNRHLMDFMNAQDFSDMGKERMMESNLKDCIKMCKKHSAQCKMMEEKCHMRMQKMFAKHERMVKDFESSMSKKGMGMMRGMGKKRMMKNKGMMDKDMMMMDQNMMDKDMMMMDQGMMDKDMMMPANQ